MKVKKWIENLIMKTGSEVAQKMNKTIRGEKEVFADMAALCRQAATEGIVMLKNDGTLPLDKETVLSVFGRVQCNYFYVGYGSGGDVTPPYKAGLLDSLEAEEDISLNEELAKVYREWCEKNPPSDGFWGFWPRYYEEMKISDAQVAEAAEKSDVAMVVIGRAAGEDRENVLEQGSYYLTEAETKLLQKVTTYFEKTIVLIDSGNVMDLSWLSNYGKRIGAVLYAWQGGMESGHAIADIVSGKVSPSGKLTDTFAWRYEDYPSANCFGNKKFNFYEEDIYVGYRYFETFAKEKVQFPFGYGLSYTSFSYDTKFDTDGLFAYFAITVTNTGTCAGADAVQVYINPPQGRLGKPYRNLCAFGKTSVLAPGETEVVHLEVDVKEFASYDDAGKTGYESCYVLEPGEYEFYVGADVRSACFIGSISLEEILLVEQLTQRMASVYDFNRIRNADGKLIKEEVPLAKGNLKEDILANLPSEIQSTIKEEIHFTDVQNGRYTVDDFIAQLSLKELEALSRGEGEMNSALGAEGNAGMLGGTIESLRQKGVPTITTTDGPSGIRLATYTSLLPCGTALASTWNLALIQTLHQCLGEEMLQKGSDILLAPGMNIHRDPLGGRNFEYYSEDPYLTGKVAAACVKGIQATGRAACPKHFACNNQEVNRTQNDSRVSERALREIYLKGFEICVKEANPKTIMTSYNKINGVWSHYNYELCTVVLREEWGFDGCVLTDWWMQQDTDPNFPNLRNNAYRVRAQVDVLMPGGDHMGTGKADKSTLESIEKQGGLTRAELERGARNVLNLAMGLSMR